MIIYLKLSKNISLKNTNSYQLVFFLFVRKRREKESSLLNNFIKTNCKEKNKEFNSPALTPLSERAKAKTN
jgi:hypothetical protein